MIHFLISKIVQIINKFGSSVAIKPFFSSKDFFWTGNVEKYFPDIVDEVEKVLELPLKSMTELSNNKNSITDDSSWKTYFLYIYGEEVENNTQECPSTKRALEHIPGIKTAFFSILPPKTKIPPHYGPYNGVLRYHLGVKVPNPPKSCGIKVKNETRYWSAGKSLIFDDSYKHEAWNDSSETRVVLFVDFIRPMRIPFKWLNEMFYENMIEQKFNVQFMDNVLKNKDVL